MNATLRTLLLLLALAGMASAQPAPAPTAAPPSVVAPASEPSPAAPASEPSTDAQATCIAALNADPVFANRVLRIVDEKKVIELENAQRKFESVHVDAAAKVAQNQRAVLVAYIAMWIIAVGFLLYMWRRQRDLQTQLAQLSDELSRAKAGK